MKIQNIIQNIYVIRRFSLAMAESVRTEDQGLNMGLGTAIVVGAGVAIGVATGDIAVWTALGGAGGVAVGAVRSRR